MSGYVGPVGGGPGQTAGGPATGGIAARPPRWGRQTSIVQPRQPAYWLFLILAGIGALVFLIEAAAMSTLTIAFALSWALMAVYAVPVAFLIYRLDLFEREPKSMLAGAIIWGGVIATSLAIIANEAWLSVIGKVTSPDFATQWGTAIVGPGVEETLKLMGVAVLFLIASDEFDGVMDGFVYGAMIGLGFTVVEDVSYFFTAAAALPGTVNQAGPVIDTFLLRVGAGGLYGHVLFTGLTGIGFAYLVTQRTVALPKRVAGAALCIAAGVAGHVIWNSPLTDFVLDTPSGTDPTVLQWILWGGLKGLPFLILLGVLVVLATRSEEAGYRAIVAGEPDAMVVTDHEMRSLGSLWARRSARATAGRLHGRMAARLVGQLQAAQIEYALVRSTSDSAADPALDAERLKIRWIRSQLAGTPYMPTVLLPQPSVAPTPSAAGGAPLQVAGSTVVPGRPQATPAAPIHLVPRGGMAAWPTPDGSRLPAVVLPERLQLIVEARSGAWAEVRAANGWRGWVDGRLLADPG
jgi:RsiW-degrading membrane proteinase PrsW (M82 family)